MSSRARRRQELTFNHALTFSFPAKAAQPLSVFRGRHAEFFPEQLGKMLAFLITHLLHHLVNPQIRFLKQLRRLFHPDRGYVAGEIFLRCLLKNPGQVCRMQMGRLSQDIQRQIPAIVLPDVFFM